MRGGRTEWSADLLEMLGVSPSVQGTELIDVLRDLLHEEDRERVELAYRHLVHDHEAFDIELRIVRPDGRVRHLQSIGAPTKPDAGDDAMYVCFFCDVTEEGGGEERASQAQKVDTLGHGEIVMLVEDYEGARVVLGEVLEEAGYRTLLAASGEEALAQCERLERPLGVLLTDVQMPGLSGLELARTLRARWPSLKVILMSGDAPDSELPEAVFLQKPVKLEEVLHRIRNILDAS